MLTRDTCLQCGTKISGRSDKKFCSDQCRNLYNYHYKAEDFNFIKRINNILKRNRRILTELNPNETTKVHKDELLRNGFNFNYFTNIYTTKTGKTYFFCYEQGYLPLSGDYYALVQRKEYV